MPSTKNPCRVIEGNLIASLPSSIGDLLGPGDSCPGDADGSVDTADGICREMLIKAGADCVWLIFEGKGGGKRVIEGLILLVSES